MKTKTRWKRVKNCNIVGKRFFDGGEYGLSFFTVLKAYKCKVCCRNGEAPDRTHWFDEPMIIVKTDEQVKYKIPFTPWAKIYEAGTQKSFAEFYNENPW